MKIISKINIKNELRHYMVVKEAMEQPMPSNLILRRQLLQSVIVMHAIEDALDELPADIVEYANLKYFNKKPLPQAIIQEKLNVSVSTAKRWDTALIEAVAHNIKSVIGSISN